MSKEYLYHYAPLVNTIDKDGIQSTALAEHGWEKYKDLTRKPSREAVLDAIDNLKPGFRRSYAISGLTEPIPDDAAEDFVRWRARQRLYRFDASKLLAAGLLNRIEYAPPRTFRLDTVDHIEPQNIDWKTTPDGPLFKDIPHYLVETRDGKIPPKYVKEVQTKRAPYKERNRT